VSKNLFINQNLYIDILTSIGSFSMLNYNFKLLPIMSQDARKLIIFFRRRIEQWFRN